MCARIHSFRACDLYFHFCTLDGYSLVLFSEFFSQVQAPEGCLGHPFKDELCAIQGRVQWNKIPFVL